MLETTVLAKYISKVMEYRSRKKSSRLSARLLLLSVDIHQRLHGGGTSGTVHQNNPGHLHRYGKLCNDSPIITFKSFRK